MNGFVQYHHFKPETLDHILKSIGRNNFFSSLDLSDVYFSVPIQVNHRKHLTFYWKNQLYAFQCLPFSIASAPRVFTKIMKVVFSHIRCLGISSFYYIDDSLLQDSDFNIANKNTKLVREFIESLGFLINKEKSNFVPSQQIVFPGFIFDSVQFQVFLPENKIKRILDLSKYILKHDKVCIRDLAKLIGVYSSTHHAVLYAHLFHRYLDIDRTRALFESDNNFNFFTNLSAEDTNPEVSTAFHEVRSDVHTTEGDVPSTPSLSLRETEDRQQFQPETSVVRKLYV